MGTQPLSSNLPETPPSPAQAGGLFGWWRNWVTPRSTNRDEAFRERTIRITVAGLILATGTSFLSAIPILDLTGELVTYPNLTIVIFFIFVASAVAVARREVTVSGLLLVAGLSIAAYGVTMIDKYTGQLVLPVYMLVVLIAGLVLPRSRLLPMWGINVAIYSVIAALQHESGFYPPNLDKADPAVLFISMVNIITMLGVEVFFLNRLRVEFDERLSDVRRSFQQAEEARREADKANQAKSRFLASMSHEFRTPLNAIIGYIDIMLTGMAGDAKEQRDRMYTHIRDNATRLLASINDTLDMARIESGRVRIDVAELSPRQVVESMVGSMNSLAHKRNIYLKAEFSDDVPEMVICDKTKLQQVLTNLIGNALKFTEQGGVTVAVSSAGAEKWRVVVTDTGIGMPEDAATYVFEAFRQVEDDNRRKYEGTGLGLAITRRWITLMGGTVELKTAPGKGSTFLVTLPTKVIAGEADEHGTQERKSVTASTR